MGTKSHEYWCCVVCAAFIPAAVIIDLAGVFVGFTAAEECDDFVLAGDVFKGGDITIENDFDILEVFEDCACGGKYEVVLYSKVLCFDDNDIAAFMACEKCGHKFSKFGVADVDLMRLNVADLLTKLIVLVYFALCECSVPDHDFIKIASIWVCAGAVVVTDNEISAGEIIVDGELDV